MAVEKTPQLAKQFWPIFFRQKILLIITIQIVISLSIGVILIVTNTMSLNSIIFWALGIFLLTVNLVSSILIFISTTRPTRELLAAIINISGEQSSLTPPNPNTAKNERTGFRDALQTIYELSSKSAKNENETDNSIATKTSAAISALGMTVCGLIALDKDRKVIYANKSAPLHIDSNGTQIIDLLFNGKDTLDSWLDDCAENSVHAEHTWARVPNRLPNQENRRFFDVMASYQKDSTVETVLVLIDKTSNYVVDEENLDFMSFAAHELRGPITVIRGYLDVLEDELSDVLKNDQQELFHRIIVSSNRLSGYIDNILNTSRYDRRHFRMNLIEDTVEAVYDTISDDMKLRAGAQNRLLAVHIPSDLPTIAADRASLSEVFGNLIDNALKYSNEGGTVNIIAKTNGDFIDVSFIDKGIGMPESVISNLFQKFYRSHRSRETVAGTGIGLYISKAIVESHGGTISVRSEDGRGSIFTVSLPIYATVADKLKAGDNSNADLISEGTGWIKNHSMYRS